MPERGSDRARDRDSRNAVRAVWPLFLKTHAILIDRIQGRMAEADLPPLTWYDVLWALERADGGRIRLSELAERTVLSRSSMTRLIDRLEEAGYVAREPSEEDGRGAYAVILPAGKKERARMWPTYARAIRTLFASHFEPGEARAMEGALRRILAAAQAPRP